MLKRRGRTGVRSDRRRLSAVGVVAVVSGALLAACTSQGASDIDAEAPNDAGTPTGSVIANATVDFVIDGDTIDVIIDGNQDRVRLTGIDTPEVARPATGDRPARTGECYGDEATAFTESLIPEGTAVRLERDVVGRDDFGRLLAYVYRASDGIFVNYEIVRQGFAQPLTIPPNDTYADLMVEAARAAERDDVGLWSACRS